MLGTTFYHGTVRKITVAFGTLFNNIHIQRRKADGTLEQDIKVPVSYESKQKYISRLIQNKVMDEGLAAQTIAPRISFIMTGMTYDEDRKVNTMNNIKRLVNDGEDVIQQRSPMPYNFDFSVNIYTKHLDDALQIVEQIVPYFHPDFNITIKDIPEMDIRKDIPVILNSIAGNVETEGALVERRIINWALDFTVKGYVYPPVRENDGKLIRKITNNFWSVNGNNLREDLESIEKAIVYVNPLGICSDASITDETTCLASGVCSDPSFTIESACTSGGGTWTQNTWDDTDETDSWEPDVIIE